MNYGIVLAYLRPDAQPNADYFASEDGFKWLGSGRPPTEGECVAAESAAIAAVQAEYAKRIESTTARDDAKRALSALDTIITGIDAATLVQAKAAIKQLAQIQKHIILATLGR